MVLKYLEKLGEITSIGVAKQHIELLAAQLDAKEKECERLEQDVVRLQSGNDRLTGENSRLKKAAEEAKPKQVTGPELGDDQVGFLQYLFDSGPDGLLLEEMASLMGIKPSMVEYHKDVLEGKGLVEQTRIVMDEGIYYGLSARGRAYVVENKSAS